MKQDNTPRNLNLRVKTESGSFIPLYDFLAAHAWRIIFASFVAVILIVVTLRSMD